jgi:hypothetical protein
VSLAIPPARIRDDVRERRDAHAHDDRQTRARQPMIGRSALAGVPGRERDATRQTAGVTEPAAAAHPTPAATPLDCTRCPRRAAASSRRRARRTDRAALNRAATAAPRERPSALDERLRRRAAAAAAHGTMRAPGPACARIADSPDRRGHDVGGKRAHRLERHARIAQPGADQIDLAASCRRAPRASEHALSSDARPAAVPQPSFACNAARSARPARRRDGRPVTSRLQTTRAVAQPGAVRRQDDQQATDRLDGLPRMSHSRSQPSAAIAAASPDSRTARSRPAATSIAADAAPAVVVTDHARVIEAERGISEPVPRLRAAPPRRAHQHALSLAADRRGRSEPNARRPPSRSAAAPQCRRRPTKPRGARAAGCDAHGRVSAGCFETGRMPRR